MGLRAIQGAIMGSGAPIGWAAIQYMRGFDVTADIYANSLLYLYMLVGTTAVFSSFGFYVGLQESRSRERSRRDPLTKLFNLRHFHSQLEIQLAQAQRNSTPLSLIYIDLDRFKAINDNYGHAVGDIVLIEIGEKIRHVLRKNELFARIGGEEFAILVPQSTGTEAGKLAERIRQTIADSYINVGSVRPLKITLSLGIASYRKGDTPSSLVDRADVAMYKAKRTGRNKVVIASAE